MMQELKGFSNSIVLLFPMDILRRNNMVHNGLQVDRELLYSFHMYRKIHELLNQPHHFQSKSVSFISPKMYLFNLSNCTSPSSCVIIIPTPSVVAVKPVYYYIVSFKEYFQYFKIICNITICTLYAVDWISYHWVIDNFKPARIIIISNIDTKGELQIKKNCENFTTASSTLSLPFHNLSSDRLWNHTPHVDLWTFGPWYLEIFEPPPSYISSSYLLLTLPSNSSHLTSS